MQDRSDALDRRTLIKAGAATTALFASGAFAHAQGSDRIRVGVIGCGGRGTGAAYNCVAAAPGVEIAAIGDLFPDRLAGSRAELAKLGAAFTATNATCFVGFDAYREGARDRRRPGDPGHAARTSGRSTSRPPSRPASTSSWRSRSPSTGPASAG